MGSRAWGAERRFRSTDIGTMRIYDRSGESEPLLPQAIVDKADELGWDEIWQLTYCQWCAGYAHESNPIMIDEYWEDPELGDARRIWGPSPRSIFSVVEQEEAAWVIDSEYEYPVIGLYETRLIGWWEYAFGRGDEYQSIAVPKAWGFGRDDLMIGINNTMSPQEKRRVNAFWRGIPAAKTMLKAQDSCIQIPFLTRGAFAKFRDALYENENEPSQHDQRARDLSNVLYEGPLYQFWKEVIIDNDYTWPPEGVQSFSIAYAEQVAQITRILSDTYQDLFSDEMPISPSSPIQPQEFIDYPVLPPETNLIINWRSHQLLSDPMNVIFDILQPLVLGAGTLQMDDNGNVVSGDRT